MPETTYIVLRRDIQGHPADDSKSGWLVEHANILAASAEAAVRAACKVDSNPGGTYVAIPTRSFKPVQVSAVQQTVLKLDPT